MPLAPTPGVGRRIEQANAAATILTITIRGETHTLAPNNLALTERLIVRKATGGLSFESFWNGEQTIGLDSLQVLWWLARRGGGEWQLTLTRAVEDWPADLSIDEIEVTTDDPEGDDPEA